MWQHMEGSDHCPVFAEFELSVLSSGEQQVPALCSKWFTGKQSKLSDFMTRRADAGVAEGGGSGGRKRDRPQDAGLPPPKKSVRQQKTLFSFATKSKSESKATPLPDSSAHVSPPSQSTGQLSGAWRSVFGGAPKAPLCSGHNEACVLRRVKKQGPNKDRQFWVCARPGGAKDDPKAKCDFFKWSKEKKK